MGDLSFPKSHHLRRPADFREVYGSGAKRHTPGFVIYRARNSLGHPRLGLSVNRKLGKAVRRNRLKRLIREAFRLNWRAWRLEGEDIVVIAKRKAGALAFGEVLRDISDAFAPRRRR